MGNNTTDDFRTSRYQRDVLDYNWCPASERQESVDVLFAHFVGYTAIVSVTAISRQPQRG